MKKIVLCMYVVCSSVFAQVYPWQPGQPLTSSALNSALAARTTHSLGSLTLNSVVVGNGAGDLSAISSTGNAGQLLTSAGNGQPYWATFSGTNPMTNPGDVIIGGTAGVETRLGAGANNSIFTISAGSPVWSSAINGTSIGGTTPSTGAFTTLTATTPVATTSGGTGCSSASGTCLDNISGFSNTGFLLRTGTGTYSFQPATNGVTLGNIAQISNNTVLANATSGTANISELSMPGCSTSGSALTWTTNTGFTCNTSITATNLSTGAINTIPFQSGTGTTTFMSAVNGALVNTNSSGVPSETATPVLGINGTTTGTLGLATSTGSGATTTIRPSAITSAVTITLPAATGTLLYSGGDLGTPSAGVATNLTGTATALNIGGTATTATTATNVSGGTVSATTVTATSGAITPHYPTGVVGITSGSAITAGSIGQVITATVSALSLTASTNTNVTSISVTAGNWLIFASGGFDGAGSTTQSNAFIGISSVSATFPAEPNYSGGALTVPAGGVRYFSAPVQNFNISGTTTYYCVMFNTFAISTLTATCTITALRVS